MASEQVRTALPEPTDGDIASDPLLSDEERFEAEITELSPRLDKLAEQAGVEPEAWSRLQETVQLLRGYSPFNYAHSLRTAIYTDGLARLENLSNQQQQLAVMGAYAHDLGKYYLDKRLIEAKEDFNEAKRAAIKPHAKLGYEMLQDAGFQLEALIAGWHHQFQGDAYGVEMSKNWLPPSIIDQERPRAFADVSHVAELVALADSFDAGWRNDRDLSRESETAHGARLLEQFPNHGRHIDWLFANRIT